MVTRHRRLPTGALLAATLSCLVVPRLTAHEVNIHRLITEAAIAHLAQMPDMAACRAIPTALVNEGVTKEDDTLPVPHLPLWPFGRFMHHFSPFLNDLVNNTNSTHVFSTCSSFSPSGETTPEWAFDAVSCLQSLDGIQRTDMNPSRYADVVNNLRALPGTMQKSTGMVGLGHFLHLLQDLTSPAHVHRDAHPPVSIAMLDHFGDPSKFEVFNANHQALPNRPLPPVGGFSSVRGAFTALRDMVQRDFLSEKGALELPASLQNQTVCLDPSDPASCGYLVSPPPQNRLLAYLSRSRRTPRFIIDAIVADAQFSELAPLAVAYTAEVMRFIHDHDAPLCEQELRVRLTGDQDAGGVISDSDGFRPSPSNRITCNETSLPGSVDRCEHSFPSARTVSLNAVPQSNATFMGWTVTGCSGGACDCPGTGTCRVRMDGSNPIVVSAEFRRPVQYDGRITIGGSPISMAGGVCVYSEESRTVGSDPVTLTVNPNLTGNIFGILQPTLTLISGNSDICPAALGFSGPFGVQFVVGDGAFSGSHNNGVETWSASGAVNDSHATVTLTKTYNPGFSFTGTVSGTFTLTRR
jgi:hypothetical protein